MDSSGDREPDYSLKYYVNRSFQGIADYNYSTGGFNLRGELFCVDISLFSPQRPLCVVGRLGRGIMKAGGGRWEGKFIIAIFIEIPSGALCGGESVSIFYQGIVLTVKHVLHPIRFEIL